MADALCGPSNALSSFQKHSSVDRTLQQDRLRARQSPLQGFRSVDRNAGVLDPEFEAFQTSQPTLRPFPEHAQAPFHSPSFQQSGLSNAGPSDWAADFQRLSFNPSVSSPQWAHPQHAPGSFKGKNALHASTHNAYPMSDYAPPTSQYQNPAFSRSFAQPFNRPAQYDYAPMQQQQPLQQDQDSQDNLFDESAFEAAFDQAREHMLAEEQAFEQLHKQEPASAAVDALEDDEDEQMSLDAIPMDQWSEEIQRAQQHQEQQLDDARNEDEIARTAGELLDKVSKDRTDKFQNSEFLSLMRKLRDREVKVEGDKVVETGTSAIGTDAPLAQAEPLRYEERVHHNIPPTSRDMGQQATQDGQAVVDLLNGPLPHEKIDEPSKQDLSFGNDLDMSKEDPSISRFANTWSWKDDSDPAARLSGWDTRAMR